MLIRLVTPRRSAETLPLSSYFCGQESFRGTARIADQGSSVTFPPVAGASLMHVHLPEPLHGWRAFVGATTQFQSPARASKVRVRAARSRGNGSNHGRDPAHQGGDVDGI